MIENSPANGLCWHHPGSFSMLITVTARRRFCITLQRTETVNKTRKLCHRNDDRVICAIYGCPRKFPDSAAIFPQKNHGFLFRSTLWMCIQNLKSDTLPVPEIIEVGLPPPPQKKKKNKSGSLWISPRSLFSKFLMDFCSDGPCECTCQIWSPYSFTLSWDNRG